MCSARCGCVEGTAAGSAAEAHARGEAGVGQDGAPRVRDARPRRLSAVVRVAGMESEMELAFAGLHQLCAPMLDRLERVPGPQRAALETTFGLGAGAVPDRFLVGLAVLSLLSEVAQERPLLCVVDDAQWLDRASAQALAFVARRLLAEPVVMLFAAREPSDSLTGLPELVLRGWGCRCARALGLGDPWPAGRADRRAGRRRDAGKPVGVARAAAGAQRRPVGGRLRVARRAVAVRAGSRRASAAA